MSQEPTDFVWPDDLLWGPAVPDDRAGEEQPGEEEPDKILAEEK